MGKSARLVFFCFLIAGSAAGQIVLEDRRLEGTVGFVNGSLIPPELVVPDEILARSIGVDPPFNNIGVVVEDPLEPPIRRFQEVVVQAFGGDYWLTSLLRLGNGQRYRFGYAAHEDGPPGYPEFLNEVYRPITQEVTNTHPPVITGVDLLECAGLVRVHFIEADSSVAGGWRLTDRAITSVQVRAFPREDPADTSPPFEYRSGSISSIRGGAQAEGGFATGGGAHLWVRSSEQTDGGTPEPLVGYRIRVDWIQTCVEPNPVCPDVVPTPIAFGADFEGESGTRGVFSGGLPSTPGLNPGIQVGCDEALDLYVLVPACPEPPCLDPGDPGGRNGRLQGCVNMIGERELLVADKTLVRGGGAPDATSITNVGEPPTPYSALFSRFDPADSEGIYELDGVSGLPGSSVALRTQLELGDHPALVGRGLISHVSALADAVVPDEGTVGPGPDFCMVPGIYLGALLLSDEGLGGSAGTLRDLKPLESFFFARGSGGGTSVRLFGDMDCDFPAGRCLVPFENVFGNPEHVIDSWKQDIQHHAFENLSTQPTLFTRGKTQLVFGRPKGAVTWDPLDFTSLAAGGRWGGQLEPSTEIAARPFRTVPVDYEICYATLRIQVLSSEVLFFEPRITTYRGTFLDDRGTPTPLDDISYTAVPASPWEGSPRTIEEAANEGWVVLDLPAGSYRGLAGFLTTVLGGGLTGTTQLPSLDVDLACGQSCTARPNAIVCVSPIEPCNDPDVLDDDRITVGGLLSHEEPIVEGSWRINDGPEHPIDLDEAGITCGPSPCIDSFAVEVWGFSPCRNDIEIRFIDAAGEPISAFLSTIVDSNPPTFHPRGEPDELYDCGSVVRRVVPCGSNESVSVDPPEASDDCSSEGDPEQPLLITEDWPEKFEVGTTVASVEAVDACGNLAVCEVTVIVVQESGEPECPAPLVIECDGPDGLPLDDPAIQDWLDQARGACGGLLENDAPEVFPVGCGPEDATTVTFTSTDPDAPGATCVSTVSIVDTTPPDLQAPPALALPCKSPDGLPWDDEDVLAWLAQASAQDLCSDVVITSDAPEFFPSGCAAGEATTVTFTARDACGNESSASSTLTVFDDTPPELIVPEPLLLECSGPGGVPLDDPAVLAWLAQAMATDLCGGVELSDDAPPLFPTSCLPGTPTLVTFTARDDCDNVTVATSTVTVLDTTAPELIVPEPLLLECSGPDGVPLDDPAVQAWLAQAMATDLCGGVELSDDAPPLFPTSCLPGTSTLVTFTARDDCDNVAVATSTVTVLDTTAPDLEVPEPLTLECTSPGGVPLDDPAVQAWLAQAFADDLCGGVELSNDAPALFPSGCLPGETTTVTFTARDDCDNLTTATSTLTVVDTTAPSLVVPPPIVLECTSPEGRLLDDPEIQAWLALAMAEDLCGDVTLSNDAPDVFPSGCAPGLTTPVTFTAVDDCGNSVTGTSSVTVVDTTPPVIDVQPSLGEPCAYLWPPRHGYATFSLEETGIEAHDLCGDVRLEFAGCASSQPEDNAGDESSRDGGDGETACDCATSPDRQTVALRAERNGGCAPLGRTYTLWIDAIDDCGNRTRAEPITVCVPHDARRGALKDRTVHSSDPGSHAKDDLCLQGWANGSYPEPTRRGQVPACGPGCEPACGPER